MSTTSISVTFTIQNNALYDAEAYRMLQQSSPTTLSSALNSSQTTVVLANTTLQVNQAFLIDSEPFLITAVQSPGTYTVTRSSCLSNYTVGVAASHSAGATVYLLTYNSLTSLLKYSVGLFLQNTVITNLGTSSMTTGSLQAAISTAQTSIANTTAPGMLVT